MEECPANAESFTIVCCIMPLEFIKSISVYSYSFHQTNPPLIITSVSSGEKHWIGMDSFQHNHQVFTWLSGDNMTDTDTRWATYVYI